MFEGFVQVHIRSHNSVRSSACPHCLQGVNQSYYPVAPFWPTTAKIPSNMQSFMRPKKASILAVGKMATICWGGGCRPATIWTQLFGSPMNPPPGNVPNATLPTRGYVAQVSYNMTQEPEVPHLKPGLGIRSNTASLRLEHGGCRQPMCDPEGCATVLGVVGGGGGGMVDPNLGGQQVGWSAARLPGGGGGSVGTPTYIPRNDPRDTLIVWNISLGHPVHANTERFHIFSDFSQLLA